MKKLKIIGTLLLIGACFSCNKNEELTQDQEAQELIQMFHEIEIMARSVKCSDSSKWTSTAYGSKACGGPNGYIAYSTTINVELFLAKIEEHRIAEDNFNNKWGVSSDCLFVSPPKGLKCENGEPVLVR